MHNCTTTPCTRCGSVLTTGDTVRLPDGDTGIVQWHDADEVHVIHPGRATGVGPWYYRPDQVTRIHG